MRFASFYAKSNTLAMVVLVFMLLFSGALAAPREQSEATIFSASSLPNVYFSLDPIEIGVGSVRDVNIVVENVEGLYALELRISFPNSLTQVVDADASVPGVQIRDGDIFGGFHSYTIQNNVDNTTGRIEYIRTIAGSDRGRDGRGIIATIPLRGVAAGQGVMAFVEMVLCERDGTSILATYRDSRVNITVMGGTPTPTPTLPPGVTPTLTHTPSPGPSPTPRPNAVVRVVPILRQIIIGDTSIVQVEIADVCDLNGFDARLDFNGARLDVEDAIAAMPGIQAYMGNVFDGFSYQVSRNEVSDDGLFGQVRVAAYLTGAPPQGFCGRGVLFWVVFRGVSVGWSNVTLTEVTLVDRGGNAMPRQLSHGQVEVLAQAPSVTPSISPTPMQTLTPQWTTTSTPTPTGTLPTATPTPEGALATATPSPSRALVTPTPVCADRISNGGFESLSGGEAPPWVRAGGTSYTSFEHRTGARSAWLGGYNNATDTLYQQVSIPSHTAPDEVTQVTLGFWWGMVTQEETHPSDFMQVCIRNASGALLETLTTIDDGAVSGAWREAVFDLSAYKGQTIRICFEATTDGKFPTSFFVDDVSLIICEILQPTPTHTPSPSPTISPTPSITGLPTNTPTITPTPVVVVFQYKEGEYEGCYDTIMDEWQPTTNYGHQGALAIRTNGLKRPLIFFDVSRIPAGVTVIDARLWLYTSHYRSHPVSMTVSAYGLKRSWVEMETTWQRARSGENWSQPGASDTLTDRDDAPSSSRLVFATNTWYDFDVTSLVQGWVNGTRQNNGVLLIATGNTVETSFWSSEYSLANLRPRLVVQYVMGALVPTPTHTPIGPTPTGGAPTATPTATRAGNEMIFQQGYLGYAGVTDTHISAWEPTSNFGGSVSLLMRQGDVRSTLLRFDLSALPAGVTIQEAKLGLYALERSNPNPLTISVYQVLRPWAENQATWNRATSTVSWGLPGCNQLDVDRAATAVVTRTINSVGSWHEWDITSLVQTWAANPASNRGVILKGSGSTSVEYSYASSEYWWGLSFSPRLVVRYTTP